MGMGRAGILASAIGACTLGACDGNAVLLWRSTVGASLDTPPAPPAAQPNDPYPSTCNVYAIYDQPGGFDQADCTCYLHAGLSAVWAAIQDPDVTEDVHTVDLSVRDVLDPDPLHPIHQVIHYDLDDVVPYSYDLDWVHILDAGTVQDPRHVVVIFRKIAGTADLSLWEASFELTSPADGITQLTLSMHEDGAGVDLWDVKSAILGYYRSIGHYVGAPASP